MKYTIAKMKNKLEYLENNKDSVSLNGYAFIDECGNCIIIVYGEGRKDSMTKYLDNKEDPLKLKYYYVDLWQKQE